VPSAPEVPVDPFWRLRLGLAAPGRRLHPSARCLRVAGLSGPLSRGRSSRPPEGGSEPPVGSLQPPSLMRSASSLQDRSRRSSSASGSTSEASSEMNPLFPAAFTREQFLDCKLGRSCQPKSEGIDHAESA
jgi:hypothetical protein